MGRFEWEIAPPRSTAIGDHAVPLLSSHLQGRRIALVVCGGIAAYRAPEIARALRRRGAEVTAFCSPDALHYVGSQALEWATLRPLITSLSWRAEHLSDSEPFAAWLVAPATFNTIGKLAHGIADTVVTSALASALGRLQRGETAVLMAPTMHGSLHTPIFEDNCRRLQQLGVRFIPPRDAYGKHNLPAEELLVAAVCRALSASPLRHQKVLVTGGPTPVPLDGVRRIVNRFSGRLGIRIAEELTLRGAAVQLILGEGSAPAPDWLPCTIAASYDEYRRLVLEQVAAGQRIGIFAAAVADYRPRQVVNGKIASGQALLPLELVPTEKVIERVAATDPALKLVTFKVLEGVGEAELLAEARRRLGRSALVVANRSEDVVGEDQIAWLVSRTGETRIAGKAAIAAALCDQLEGMLVGEGEAPS
jgi:phosphopantothenoylcysteine decarboxylase/phosphopantothenate--cysteine ligase